MFLYIGFEAAGTHSAQFLYDKLVIFVKTDHYIAIGRPVKEYLAVLHYNTYGKPSPVGARSNIFTGIYACESS